MQSDFTHLNGEACMRYSDNAGAIIESVYKFCMEEKKSGMKLSLNRIWDRTAALTGVSRSTTQKIVEEKKKAQDEQQQPKQPPSSTPKVSLDDFDQGVVYHRQHVLLEEGSANPV